jgi:hypothetical protein
MAGERCPPDAFEERHLCSRQAVHSSSEPFVAFLVLLLLSGCLVFKLNTPTRSSSLPLLSSVSRLVLWPCFLPSECLVRNLRAMVSPYAYTEERIGKRRGGPSGGYLAGQSGPEAFASWKEDRSEAPLGWLQQGQSERRGLCRLQSASKTVRRQWRRSLSCGDCGGRNRCKQSHSALERSLG